MKKVTFIQTGRRSRDMEMQRCGIGIPHPHVLDKNQEVYPKARDPSPTSDHPAQGSSARKVSPHNF